MKKRFKIIAVQQVYYHGTVEAKSHTEIEGMDLEELDLTEFDTSTMSLIDVEEDK